jgi:hypothetical protein
VLCVLVFVVLVMLALRTIEVANRRPIYARYQEERPSALPCALNGVWVQNRLRHSSLLSVTRCGTD